MDAYMIKTLLTDGIERVASLQINNDLELRSHFLEFEEFLEDNEPSELRKIGDCISGELYIAHAWKDKSVNSSLMFSQPYEETADINMVITVKEIINSYSIKAITNLPFDEITIDFMSNVNYKVGDCVYLEGSLELLV